MLREIRMMIAQKHQHGVMLETRIGINKQKKLNKQIQEQTM
jgi:hypothetical protein